jgi:hypothetical protein
MFKTLSLLGYEVFIETMPLKAGPFAWSRTVHNRQDKELWFLGMHVVVSNLRMSPQR